MSQEDELQEYRCDCGKLLFKATLLLGVLEIKCKRCRKLLAINFEGTADVGSKVGAPVEA